MESLADTVRLRRCCFGSGVVSVVDGQIPMIVVVPNFAAVFCAAICQDSQKQWHLQTGRTETLYH